MGQQLILRLQPVHTHTMVVKVVQLFGIATFTVTDTTLAVPISMRITTTSSPTVVERTQVQEATTWSPMNSDSVWSLLMV